MNGIDTYFQTIQGLQTRVVETQREILIRVAAEMADTISVGKRIFIFGTGHSHMLAEEGFYRAGGLACVVPIFSSTFMLHENAALSSYLERCQGIARFLCERYQPQAGEIILIYSNSGVNQLPVEMALYAKENGMKVVSICSKDYARVAPLSTIGKRLYDIADYDIDNGGVPGDALVPVEGTPWRVAASSTIVNALIWNCLLSETIQELKRLGAEIPLIASLNLPGAAAHNQAVLEKWRAVNPYL